jgi:ATP-binding cassette subfamily B protein
MSQPNPPWRLGRLLAGERRRLGLAALAMAARAAVLVLAPWPLKLVVNVVILNRPVPPELAGMLPGALSPWAAAPVGLLTLLALGMAALTIADTVFDHAGNLLFLSAAQRCVFRLRAAAFAHLLRLPVALHRHHGSGELMSRLTEDVARVQDLVVVAGTGVLPHLLTLVGIVGVMLALDWRYALLAVAVLPLLALTSRLGARRLRTRLAAVRERDGTLWSMAQEVVGALPLVQSSGREGHERRRFAGLALGSLRAALASGNVQSLLAPLTNLQIGIATAVLTWYGALLVLHGKLSPGDVLLFLAYLRSMVTPARQIAKSAPLLGRSAVALDRIAGLFALAPAVTDAARPHRPARPEGHLVFDRVSFAYAPGAAVLSEVSFGLVPGEQVALVGPTGAGKSTIAALAARLLDPTAGAVRLDGADLRQLPLAHVRRTVAVVLQDAPLLRGTVWQNIAYGRPGAGRAEAVAAAVAAGVDPVIAALPDGYDHVVSEHGASLSGGQRQCVAIARATLSDARVVVLDEPTASLDAFTERSVTAALARLAEGRALLLIAHRLASVRRADRILVLEAGRIVEDGTHHALSHADGAYRRLLRAHDGLAGTAA